MRIAVDQPAERFPLFAVTVAVSTTDGARRNKGALEQGVIEDVKQTGGERERGAATPAFGLERRSARPNACKDDADVLYVE